MRLLLVISDIVLNSHIISISIWSGADLLGTLDETERMPVTVIRNGMSWNYCELRHFSQPPYFVFCTFYVPSNAFLSSQNCTKWFRPGLCFDPSYNTAHRPLVCLLFPSVLAIYTDGRHCLLYSVSQKTIHSTFDHNFRKSRPHL